MRIGLSWRPLCVSVAWRRGAGQAYYRVSSWTGGWMCAGCEAACKYHVDLMTVANMHYDCGAEKNDCDVFVLQWSLALEPRKCYNQKARYNRPLLSGLAPASSSSSAATNRDCQSTCRTTTNTTTPRQPNFRFALNWREVPLVVSKEATLHCT